MNEAMKQRLVGAIVLGCLAIIFLPILLDGEGVTPPAMNTSIADSPPFPEPLEIEPQRPEIISDTLPEPAAETEQRVEVVDAVPVGQQQASDNEEEERPALDRQGLPQAWSIRLGLFADPENAENLVNRLLNADYEAYSEVVLREQGELNAVFVGPVLTRAEAESLRGELAENFQLDGIVVDFTID